MKKGILIGAISILACVSMTGCLANEGGAITSPTTPTTPTTTENTTLTTTDGVINDALDDAERMGRNFVTDVSRTASDAVR